MARPFTPAWLGDEPAATALLPRAYADARARGRAVAHAASTRIHPAVLDSLVSRSDAQARSIDRLARGGCAAVLTGQQAGLFGGPLYTVYKAAAAVVDARALEHETGIPCVPMFWLQSEDHDYDEIAHCTTLDPDGRNARIEVPGDPADARRSVAARTLGPGVLLAREQMSRALTGLSHANEVDALLGETWTPDVSPSDAFKTWIERLFAPHGLLVVDPSDPKLAAAARPIHETAIRQAAPIAQVLRRQSAAIESAGFPLQVHVRPEAPLSFVHRDGPGSPRARFVRTADGYATLDGQAVDLKQAHLSTSALLRPLLQDHWLPTAATVCGPGEVAYFAQLPPLYEHLQRPMPLIVPRARFRIVDETSARLLDQLGLTADDLTRPRDALLAQLGRGDGDRPDPDALRAAIVEPMEQALDTLAPHAAALDNGLERATQKTRRHLADVADKLVDRYRRTLARADQTLVDRLDRVTARLHPGGPQERIHSWPWYAARYGVRGFVDSVVEAVRPLDGALQELVP